MQSAETAVAQNLMQVSVHTPDHHQMNVQAERALNLAKAYKITDATMYQLAAEDLQKIKGRLTFLDTERKKITKPLDDAKKAVMDLFRGPVDMYEQAEGVIKQSMTNYTNEQERLRREEEERRRKALEWEQTLVDAYAENARINAELAAAATAAANTPEEREQAEATLTAANQKVEVARQEQAVAAAAPTPVVAVSVPKVSGIATKTTWRGECFDKMALIKAIAAGEVPHTLVDVNQTTLNQMARALKGAMTYPGCRAVEEKSIASSRASA